MTKEEAKELTEIVKGMQAKAEEFGINSPEYKTYVENSDKKFTELGEKNEELVKEYELTKKTAEENAEKVKHLEMLFEKGNTGGAVDPEQAKKDAFEVFGMMLKGDYTGAMEGEEFRAKAVKVFSNMAKQKYAEPENQAVKSMMTSISKLSVKADPGVLRSDIGELGGYLMSPEISTELNKLIIEMGPIRNFARIKNTSAKTYTEWLRVGIPIALRAGELRAGGESASKYAEQQWNPLRMTNTIPISADQLLFSAIDMVTELINDNAEAFALLEGQEFVDGDGVKGSQGFTTDPNVPEKDTATNTLEMDDLRLLIGDLKRGYNPLFMFNRRTLAYLMTLKDTTDRYLWNPPFGDAASGAPATIAGVRYSADFIEFDDVTVNNGFPILLADMSKFYQIVDRTDITMIRDQYTEAKEAAVNFTMHKWSYGKPKIHEAGVRLKKIA